MIGIDTKGLTDQWADFLNQWKWDWYATLTFKDPISIKKAFKSFNEWKVALKHAVKQRIDYAMVIEYSKSKLYIPHIHIFLSGAKNEKPYKWEKRWYQIGGIAKIKGYNPEQGASYYLAKKIAGGKVDLKLSKNLQHLEDNSDNDKTINA